MFFVIVDAVVWPIFFGLGVAAAAIVLTFVVQSLKHSHRRRAQHRHPRDPEDWHNKYGLSLLVTAIWVTIVMVLSGDNWRDEEIMWLCIGAIASVFLLPRIAAFFTGSARALVTVGLVFLGLFVVFALFWGVMPVDSMHNARSEVRAMAAEAEMTRPKPAGPLLLQTADIKGNLDTVEMAKFLENAAVQRWVKSVVPNVDLGLGQGYSFSTQGQRFAVGLQSFWNLSSRDRTRVAAALGMAAEVMFPGRVVGRVRADNALEKVLAANPFAKPDR